MLRNELTTIIYDKAAQIIPDAAGNFAGLAKAETVPARNPQHGDFATNIAMIAAKAVSRPPRELAESLAAALEEHEAIAKAEAAGPGFVNLTLAQPYLAEKAGAALADGSNLNRIQAEKPLSINVEYVSVNPNGPITVGSGRGAAYGSTLCNVLEAAGHTVHREYYINDGVNSEQMRLFALSVRHYIKLAQGQDSKFPENGYAGDYVERVAQELIAAGKVDADASVDQIRNLSQQAMIDRQRADLAKFQVEFDTWFSEQSLHDTGLVEKALKDIEASEVADYDPIRYKRNDQGELEAEAQPPGALWLRSTKFGDDMDRVLIRADKRPTYIASDVAYHRDKFNRPPGADKLITVLGPDHHGYIQRLKAVVQAVGYQADQLEVQIFQIVRFIKDGKPAPMRKRDGNIYALSDLLDELGSDVVRFFYLMRSHDTHLDFNLDLAAKQSDENPVFYVQYAHARICSLIAKAKDAGLEMPSDPRAALELLDSPAEKALMIKCLDLPHEIQRCAKDYGVHRLTTFAIDIARMFHLFYDRHRVVGAESKEVSEARIALCTLAKHTLAGVLELLGVSAPERMERAEQPKTDEP